MVVALVNTSFVCTLSEGVQLPAGTGGGHKALWEHQPRGDKVVRFLQVRVQK